MRSVCPHDCPSACSLEVTVEDGRIAGVIGGDHPFTQGVICGKVREYAERVHSPLRILRPLRRAGAKRVLISAPSDGADLTVVYGVKIGRAHV